jgi:hypothetical protein
METNLELNTNQTKYLDLIVTKAAKESMKNPKLRNSYFQTTHPIVREIVESINARIEASVEASRECIERS